MNMRKKMLSLKKSFLGWMDNFVRLAILGNKSIKQGYHKHSQVAYKILFG